MKKVAIVGAEPQTREKAPWGDESFEIWTVNEWANKDWCKRCDALFQLHKPKIYKAPNENDPEHWSWLQKKHEFPIYMQEVDKDVPSSKRFPKQEILNKYLAGLLFEGIEVDNVKSSVAWAVAYACYVGVDQIDIYGVEMANPAVYKRQGPNFTFWIGVARGLGIIVNLHSSRKLFDGPLYGYEHDYNDKVHEFITGMKLQKEEFAKKNDMIDGALMGFKQLLDEEYG